jgi:NAD-dependent deacetylase
VPTFRGPGGLWKQYRPEDLATPEAFARDPRLVWEWYGWRRDLVSRCRPNAAHLALARWMRARAGVILVTQNVDDLHERAARDPGVTVVPLAAPLEPRFLKLHGSLFRVRCTRCDHQAEHGAAIDATSGDSLPRCPACGALLRPDVVWFGESLPPGAMAAAFAAAGRAQACLVIGTTGAVYPAAAVAHQAQRAGAAVIVVDPGRTEYDAMADVRITAPAGAVLGSLIDAA